MTDVVDVPARCPTCGTEIPKGRTRCVGCGKVFGEDNRCPSCHAIAGIVPSANGTFACAACSAPRERLPGTVVLSGANSPASAVLPPVAARASRISIEPGANLANVAARGKGAAMRSLGVLVISGAMLAAIAAAMIVPGTLGFVVAGALGLLGVAGGGYAMRSGSRTAAQGAKATRELQIVALAKERNGALTATETAERLGTTVEEADRALTAMADGTRVTVDVDDEGIVRYVFREIAPETPRVRVALDEEEELATQASETQRRNSAK